MGLQSEGPPYAVDGAMAQARAPLPSSACSSGLPIRGVVQGSCLRLSPRQHRRSCGVYQVSARPAVHRRSKNRGHFPTVGLDTLSSSATAVFVFPSASEYDPRPLTPCAVFGTARPRSQCLPFFIGQCQRRSRSARAAHVHPPQMSRQKDTRLPIVAYQLTSGTGQLDSGLRRNDECASLGTAY